MSKDNSRRGVLQYAFTILIDFAVFVTSVKTAKQKEDKKTS
jgi:hypothetical protein